MKIGIMNNPSKSVYDEAAFCGKAGFDFLDLTIEGPWATNIDIDKLKPVTMVPLPWRFSAMIPCSTNIWI